MSESHISRSSNLPRRPTVPDRSVVFVLDDDQSMLKGLERLLKAHGFEAELFDSIEDFQNRARLREALCLVLDINLGGKSGIVLRRQLQESGVSIPIIYITANDNDDLREAA